MWWSLFGVAMGGPLNAWGGAVPEGKLAINPWVYVGPGNAYTPVLYGGVGAGVGDLWVGAGTVRTAEDGAPRALLDVMERAGVGESTLLCARIVYATGDTLPTFSLEAHNAMRNKAVGLTTNLAWRALGPSGSQLVAMFGPEVFLTERWSVSAEFDAVLPFASGGATTTSLSPALGATLGRDGEHSAALGAVVPLSGGAPFPGGWYMYTFGMSGRKHEVPSLGDR